MDREKFLSFANDWWQILFSVNRKLGFQLHLKNTDGSGSEDEVGDFGTLSSVNPWDWSRDGKYVLVRKANELWYLSTPERVTKPHAGEVDGAERTVFPGWPMDGLRLE